MELNAYCMHQKVMVPVIIWRVKYSLLLIVSYTVTQQEMHFCNRSSHYESIFFIVSKDEWNIKEDTGHKKIHHTYCGMQKGTSQAEVMSNSE